MIRIAEEVNKLEHFFEQLSQQYTEEVNTKPMRSVVFWNP